MKNDDSRPRALAELTRWHAARRPGAPAITFQGRTVTYGELDGRANRVAQGLIAGGVPAGARVAILAKNSDAYVEVIVGAAKAGAVVLPVNWRLAAPEMTYVLQHGEAVWLFVEPEFLPLAGQLAAVLRSPAQVTVIGAPEGLGEPFLAWRDRHPEVDPGRSHPPDEVVLQMYTSGTTGLPKGVQLTNENCASSIDIADQFEWQKIPPEFTVFSSAPFFHLNGLIPTFRSLHSGSRLLTVVQFRAAEVVEMLTSERVNRAGMAPAMIQMCLDVPGVEDRAYPDLRLITYGGSPISERLMLDAMRVFGCAFSQGYGMTESSGAVVALPPEDHTVERGKLRACGRPLPGVEVKVVDPEGRDLPPRAVGEVVIRGPVVMAGYWGDPDATGRTIGDGWLHSGDAGYFDEEGYLYIHDRVKQMIVSGAENIYPAEVENAMAYHPDVADVAVIGVPDPRWGEAVKALVVPRPGASPTAEALIAHARAYIAGYKLPKSVDFVDNIPRNHSGKILRRELREPYWKGAERQVN